MSSALPHFDSGRPNHDGSLDSPDKTLFVTGQTPVPEMSRLDSLGLEELSDGGIGGSEEAAAADSGEYSLYSQEEEQLPQHAAYAPEIHMLEEKSRNLSQQLYNILAPHRKGSVDVANLASRARAASDRPAAPKKTIMLLGHTGTGKSSTTNSFVDDMDATRAASSGESVTCVPTRIVDALPGQQQRYAGEVRLFDDSTMSKFLKEQIENFVRWHFQEDTLWGDDERREYQARANTALKIFRALFPYQEGFDSSGAIKAYFEQYDVEHILSNQKAWCINLIGSYEPETKDQSLFLRFEAGTIEELNDQMDPHIFEQPVFDEPALWPLVESVRKSIPDSRILKYVDLLDLPGTADTNRVRAEIAHKFVQESDALWCVTNINRSVSDAPLDNLLATYAEKFGDNVAIIATGSDNQVNDALAKQMQRQRQSTGQYSAQAQVLKAIDERIAMINWQLPAPGSKKRQRISSSAELIRLREEKDRLSEEKSALKNKQLSELTEIRNSFIKGKLIEDKRKHVAKSSNLSVFAISNTHYGAHKGVASDDSWTMDVQTTNVPALRAHALLLVASTQFRHFERIVNTSMTLLDGTVLWTEAPTQTRKGLMELVKRPAELIGPSMLKYLQISAASFHKDLIEELRSNHGEFVKVALNVLDDLRVWHTSTMRSFSHKNGKHRTASRAYEVWNERFAKMHNETINAKWQHIRCKQRDELRNTVNKIQKSIKELPEELDEHKAAASINMKPLRDLVSSYVNQIDTTFEDRMAEYEKKLSNIKLNATRDVPTAYFTIAMLPMYEAANHESGPGCCARMLKIIDDCLNNTTDSPCEVEPFVRAADLLLQDLEEASTWMAKSLRRDIKAIMHDMTSQFDRAFRVQRQAKPEKKARESMKPFLKRIRPEVYSIKTQLAAIKEQCGIAKGGGMQV